MLEPDEAGPYELLNPRGTAPCLIVCDHASHRVPRALGDLGLDRKHKREHIAWDIGASVIARRLSELFDAPAVLAGYSRLVVDCNRYLDDPAAFVHASDGIAVPANITMPDEERARRVADIYRPYHNAIEDALEGFARAGVAPAVISAHTMTDRLRGNKQRAQQLTLCWSRDDRLARPVLDRLRAKGDINVGDNKPYRLDFGEDYTVPEHVMRRGLAHLQFEVRQDLVTEEGDARAWAELIYAITADLVANPEIRRAKHYWP